MNESLNKDYDRIVDLLVQQSLDDLDESGRLQLDELMAGIDDAMRERLETEVALALAVAGNASALSAPGDLPPPPARLLAKLESDADRFFGTATGALADAEAPVVSLDAHRDRVAEREEKREASAPRDQQRTPLAAWAGWAVAALLLVTVLVGREGPAPAIPTPAEARTALAAETGTISIEWAPSAWEDFESVRGDVNWNDERQEGYLRLSGMPANDPERSQYQLWIVDPNRDTHPVDGGVFDIPPGASEVVIPIRAALAVNQPAAFAITREQPGGVVVSEGPLLVVASRG